MRSLTSGQLAVLDDVVYQAGLRVLIADDDGVMRDYSAQAGHSWIEGVDIPVDIDQYVSQATIRLRRDIKDGAGAELSLSPLRSDSALNRNAVGAYAPAIDAGRAVQILVATTAHGTAPVEADWQNLFEGTLDDFSAEHSPLVITARDLGGALVDNYVEVETEYGSDVGVPMETVMQQILDAWAPGTTLHCPVSPSFDIRRYKQSRVQVFDALQTLAGLIGWDVRPRWDSGTSAWRLTLASVDRTKTTPDRIISDDRYLDVTQLKVGRTDVRNVVWVYYTDASTGLRTKVEAKDDDSIARFGRRWMEVDEASDSPIDTSGEATTYAEAILADLKDPKADQGIEEHFDWSVELGDLQRYTANGVHYDTDQDWAVVSYRHSLAPGKFRTTVAVRGKPCGRYLGWLGNRNLPVTSPSAAGPTLIVTAQIAASSVTIDVTHTGALTLSTDGGSTFSDLATAGVTAFPTVVVRPDVTTGGTNQRWTFKASLNGQEVTHSVDIPATEAPPSAKVPPDAVYGAGVPFSHTVTVHAEYAGRIELTAVPSARTELDDGTEFPIDATPYGYARIAARVKSAGPAGSRLALEYFDTTIPVWAQACVVDATVPIDSTGTHFGTSQALVAGVTGDTLFRVMLEGGDDASAAELGNIHVTFIEAGAFSTEGTTLYLRNTAPASAPAGSSFPRSAALPVDTLTKSTGWDTPLALLTTKGTAGSRMAFVGTSMLGVYDSFAKVFLANPFSANQTIGAGTWEFGALGIQYFTPGPSVPNVALYVLRNTAGVWSKVGTIFDEHDATPGAAYLTYNADRVIKREMTGVGISVLTGDVLALECWMHVQRGFPSALHSPTPDGLVDVWIDGAQDIPVGVADGGTYTGVSRLIASYLRAPEALSLS